MHSSTIRSKRAQLAIGQIFNRDDDDDDENAEGLEARASSLIDRLQGALQSRQEAQTDSVLGALGQVVDRLEAVDTRRRPGQHAPNGSAVADGGGEAGERSRGERLETSGGDVYEIPTGPDWAGFTRADIMDGRDRLYHRMWANDDMTRFDRNPFLDDNGARWCRAIMSGRKEEADRIRREVDDVYLRSLPSIDRAALAEGAADAGWGFGDGTGAELLPLPMASQIMIARNVSSVLRGLVNVFPMTSQTQRIPILPVVAASTRAEGADFGADVTPDPQKLMLTAKILGVRFSATGEFLADTPFNMVQQLTERAGSAIGEQEDIQMCTADGTGSSFTEGLNVNANIVDVAEATTGFFFVEDAASLYYALTKPYRRAAKFFATGTALLDIVNSVDGAGNRAFPNGALGAPRAIGDGDPAAEGSILNKNVYEIPLPDDVLMFGDPAWYALGQRAGITIRQDNSIGTNTNEYRIEERVDGRVIPTGAAAAAGFKKMVW